MAKLIVEEELKELLRNAYDQGYAVAANRVESGFMVKGDDPKAERYKISRNEYVDRLVKTV